MSSETMRAVVIPRFGDADVLEAANVGIRRPAAGEVAIDVAHAGANFAEILYRRGLVPVDLPFVPGIEVSGRVREVGPGVEGLRVGQPVAALTIVDSGGYAEVVVTEARLAAPLPEDIAPDALALAAGVPSNTTTALLVIGDVARVREGETVLVHAAAGGVGSQLGQVARLRGAGRVIGTVGSPGKREAALGFGYDEVLLRGELTGGLDIIVDPVGGPARRASIDALGPGGRLVAMGNASGGEDVVLGANSLWLGGVGVLGFNLAALSAARPEVVGAALREAVDAVLDGRVHVEIADRLPLAAAAEAHRRIESGTSTGKILLDVQRR